MLRPALPSIIASAFLLTQNLSFAAEVGCRSNPEHLLSTVQKYASAGLEDKRLTDVERDKMLQRLRKQDWQKQVPGLSAILEAGLPRLRTNNAANLGVAIHREGSKVALVEIFFPVVNIPRDRVNVTYDALYDIVDRCASLLPDTRSWLNAALRDSWEWYRDQKTRGPIIQELSGTTRVVVWGVPPDMWQILVIPGEP